ncbi:MAG: tetratricopeptide repeat protein [Kofleriaceae bacterium]
MEGLIAAARQAPPDLRSSRFAATRKLLANRGRPDAVVALIDVEIAAIGETDKQKQADLLLEKGMVLDGELLDVPAAHAAFASVLELRKNDAMAIEALEELNVAEENWQKFTAKYVQEASASTDRSLATGLYVSAAEAYVRFAPEGGEAEAHLRKALEIDPKNGKAAFHLARLLRRRERWQDLGELLDERAEKAATTEEKVAALIALSELAHTRLANGARGERALKRVLVLDPTHPRALRFVTDAAAATGDWAGVVTAYQAALKARRDGDDLGMLLQIGMVLWKHLNDLDQAEEYFRRIRKIDQAHPAALDFYRTYYTAKGETGKLMTLLKSAEKSSQATSRGPRSDSGEKSISIEIAELAEAQNNPEKAIEAWKQHLRTEPTSVQARSSLSRLYRRTEKWNALLDLMKDDIDRLSDSEVAAKVARLFEVAEIYRDRLKLDVMVINTYNAILKIDPDNQRAGDELAGKFRTLGRWNDLIAVLTRKSEAPNVPDHERVKLLREVADLWSERFGNFANAIKPLERIAELTPTDTDAINRLKEIYTKRRQWRQLIDLLGKEASTLAPADRRGKQSEMARLAAERLGDSKLAIEIHNRVLGEAGSSDVSETLAALAALYDREKRHLAYVEIVHRQVTLARAAGGAANLKTATALLEKLGQIYTERLQAPQQAAAAWKEILELEPNHAKALRTLRELYAMAGDFVGLEQLYARLGQQEELVDALLAIADRIDGKAQRLPLVERAAHLAQERSDKAKDSAPTLEKARSVWERVLAVDSQNLAAATALAPIYEKQEKWTRLLTMREIELGVATEPKAKLAKIEQIRALCEQKLVSKTLAFAWALRAFEIEPSGPGGTKLYDDVMRLASERDQWRDVVGAFERAITGGTLKEPQRLSLFRELAKIANKKLGDPEMARGYHRKVLQLAPEDRDAETHLEDLASQVADWSELLASFRRRAQRENPGPQRANLLLEAALIQEQKLVDLDGAAVTYREALEASPGHPKALRALAKVEEARGDWESLADVLSQELAAEQDSSRRFDLLMRLGSLEEHSLERPAKALPYYREALTAPAPGGGVRGQPVDAIARLVLVPETASKLDPKQRIAAVRQVLPHIEAAKRSAQQAAALEVLRASDDTSGPEKTELDRALLRIYHTDLGDPGAAWTAGLRVVAAQPQDADVRHALAALAGQLGRDGEWGKHLAAALATLKQKAGAPNDVRSVATELARLAGDRLADRATAEKAWIAVLEVQADAGDAFDALSAAYRADQRWLDLRALLERRAEVTIDEKARLAALLQLAVLEEQMLGEPVRAIAAYRRALELEPATVEAFDALDRLYTEATQWPELEELLARRAEHDPARAQSLAYRRAELFAHALGDPSRSVDLLEDVLAREPGHADGRELLEELLNQPKAAAHRMRISRVLEPLYETDKLWKDLVGLLRVQRRLVEGTEAVELLARIAVLEEAELDNGREAFDAWLEVLKLEPTDERARVELPRLAQWLSRWPEATAALENAVNATPASDIGTRGALLGELATYYDTQLGDAPRAIVAYRRLLDADQSSPATQRRAGAALARLYEEGGAWQELRDVNRKQAEWAEDATERRALLSRVAHLEETKLGASEAAITTWRDVLHDQPHDVSALHALERLYATAERWRDLVEILRRMADQSPGDAIVLLGRIAVLHEQRLKEPEEAIAAWLEILEHDGDNPQALAELARLYGSSNRHADLLDVYERQLANDPDGETLPLQIEVAKLLGGPLQRPVEALDRWENVLQVEPNHPEALAAVEAALHDPDLRAGAADILRPVYAATAKDERLASLSMRQAEWTDDPATKLRALNEVVLLREQRLGDKAGAFEAQLLALRHAATEPELARTVAETERLAGELGREAELIDVYRAVAPDVLDAEIQRRLYLDVADLARAVRRDLAMSREYYQKVLDVQPDDRRALAALESIYRETGDDEHLVEVLLRQATPEMGADIDDQVHALVEAAGIYSNLKRPDEAIGSWQQVLEIAPERADAIYALEGLYSGQHRWHDVVDLYELRLGFVTSVDEAVALRVQLGELHENHIHDIEAAIENYAAALGGNSKQPAALAALERLLNDPEARAQAAEVLEPVFVTQQRWPDLVRVYEAKLDAAADPRDRLRLTRYVARLFEEQLEDFESAQKWFAKVFREAPADPTVRDQLNRLASITENWAFVAETYQGYLDDEQGETTDVRDVAIAVATIYDRRLDDTDQAFAAYRRALAIDVDDAVPNARELVRRLEDLLGRTQRWTDLVEVYDDVITRGDDDLRIEALVKRARLTEDGLHDTARAVEAWREVVLACDSGDTPAAERAYRDAVAELERLFRLRGQWHDLVDLIEARLGRTDDETETAELRLRLAEIYEHQILDLPAAIDQYQEVLHGEKLWERGVHALERLVIHDDHRARVIELLEPVYRAQDWWQKLVVILDAKLEYVMDPFDQVQALHEIAEIHETRGGAIDLALAALARAWRIDVSDDAALTKLLSLAGKLSAWDEAARTVEDGAASASNGELAASLWARAAEIHEIQRRDRRRSIEAWRKVDEARTDDLLALAALDRLLALEGRVPELVTIVERRAELTEDAGVRLVLLHRAASLYEEVLNDRTKAIGAYKNVLGVDDSDLAALDALERLYRADSGGDAPRELAVTLERKIELSSEVAQRQQLRHAAAQVYETQLDDVYQAIGHLTAILDDDAGDQSALGDLDRIYTKQKLWPELLDTVDKRALLAANTQDRADLAFRAAKLVEVELADPDAAIPRYGAVLQVLPAHEHARAALEQLMQHDDFVDSATPILERVYRSEREAAGLIRVYERRLHVEGRDPSARRADWQALAETREQLANQPAQAFVVWGRALADDPEDADLLQPLQRLAEAQNLWRELAALLDERLEDATQPLPPDVDQAYAMRLGAISEDRLNDLDRAARAFDRGTRGPEPRAALSALERVLARGNKSAELAAVLRREADAAESETQTAEYLFRMADLHETTLDTPREAIGAYRDVLALSPSHPPARAALERMLATVQPAHKREIVEILEPLFEQDDDSARLVTVLDARLAVTDEAIDRASILQRLVEIAEHKLNDRARALDAALRWLAADPASQQALNESERLAERLGQWQETAQKLSAIVATAHDQPPDVQVALLVFLGRIQRDKLGQADEASATYRAALALEPEELAALDPLIEILRMRGDSPALADALRQRGKVAPEPAERRAAFAEVAQISERSGDRAAAVVAWREISSEDDNDRDALDQLARIYRFSAVPDDKRELVDVLSRSARLAPEPADEKQLRVEIARLESDTPRAVGAWQAVADLDPDDLSVLGQLELAHAKNNDWIAVGDIQTRRLDLANTAAEKVAIYAEMAQLAEGRRQSVDDAITAWYSAIEIDSTSQRAYDELERLLGTSSRWHDLVELLERRAELYAVLGNNHAEIQALARAADVWEAKLDNPDAAGEILEKILAREPGSVAALTRLSKIYDRTGDWTKSKATLEQALKLDPQGRDAADLFFRLGEVARVGDSDEDTAIQHFRNALRYEPTHGPSIAALEKLARERRDNALLADALKARLEAVPPATRDAASVELLVEIADLERKAGRSDAALAALARAANAAPDDVRVLAPLADMFFAASRFDEAAPIYDRLATEAKTARRMKDVAKFRQRQGSILEAHGDHAGARAAYEEALRVNPTDVVTMMGLGRLYFAGSDWEKARKIYQSLVLQNIDADAGVTKGEVYWALGKIHVELGQSPKAKSMFQRGLEIEPGNQKLREALTSLS